MLGCKLRPSTTLARMPGLHLFCLTSFLFVSRRHSETSTIQIVQTFEKTVPPHPARPVGMDPSQTGSLPPAYKPGTMGRPSNATGILYQVSESESRCEVGGLPVE